LRNPLTIVGGVVTLFALAVISIVILGKDLSADIRLIIITSILSALAATIPGVLALYKSEATQHDIRNGVVKDKVKEAITEAQVITRDGPLAQASMQAANVSIQALQKLLETNAQLTQTNAQLTTDNGKDGHNG